MVEPNYTVSSSISVSFHTAVRVIVSVEGHPLDTHFNLDTLESTTEFSRAIDRLVRDALCRKIIVSPDAIRDAILSAAAARNP